MVFRPSLNAFDGMASRSTRVYLGWNHRIRVVLVAGRWPRCGARPRGALRVFPGAGHRQIQVITEGGRPVVSFAAMAPPAGVAAMMQTRRSRRLVSSSAWVAPTPRSTPAACSPGRSSNRAANAAWPAGDRTATCGRRFQASLHHRLHAARRTSPSRPQLEDAIPVHAEFARQAGALGHWTPRACSANCAQLPRCSDVPRPTKNRGLQAYVEVDRDAAARLGVSWPPSISDAVQRISASADLDDLTQSDQYRVV